MPEATSTTPSNHHPRLVVEQVSRTGLSDYEHHRLVQLLATGLERGRKRSASVDFTPHLSVHADASEEAGQ